MAKFTVESLDNFVTQTETHLAGQRQCPISTWIPMHSNAWDSMYWSFEARGLVTGDADFKAMLEDTTRFLTVAKLYLQKSRAVKGVLSDQENVRAGLKFKFNNPTNESQKDGLTTQWVKFLHEHRDLIDNPSGSDQTELVDSFIEVNLLRGCSKAQNFIFSHLRDMKPKPTSLREAYQAVLSKWRSTEGNCEVGLQVGMIFPDPTYLQYFAPESNKVGGSATAGPKRARSDNEYQGHSTDKNSTTNFVGACTLCGIKNKHPAKSCPMKGEQGPYLNHDPNTEYANSNAWKAVLANWPQMLDETKYPRNPSEYHIKQFDGSKKSSSSSKPPPNPTGGGGRGRGDRDHHGKGRSSGRGDGKGRGKCKCSLPQHCTPTDDDHLANLLSNYAPMHLNFTNVYTPITVANTFTLIDTGALHGSYAGTWIKAHNLRAGSKKLNTNICSPINNSCISLTESVIAVVDIFDVDKKFKLQIEVEFKILSSLDGREYGLIIGLPDIKAHSLLSKFANQFTDCKVVNDKEGLESPLVRDYPKGISLSDKFANLCEDVTWVKGANGWLESLPARLSKDELTHEDTLYTATETQSHRGFSNRQHYDDDEEVIEYESWDDAWRKNDEQSTSKDKDVIDTIVDKIHSTDPSFKIEARALLSQYRDLFSRTLSVTPALLEPLTIEIDRAKFETKQAQGPPRIMSAEKDAHMEKFITEGLKSNVIRPSNSRYYSQVHLVVKPEADATTAKTAAAYPTGYDRSSYSAQAMVISDNDSQSPKPLGFAKSKLTTPSQASLATPSATPTRKWRTTIDYRHYNNCIVKQHWPLPNISAMK